MTRSCGNWRQALEMKQALIDGDGRGDLDASGQSSSFPMPVWQARRAMLQNVAPDLAHASDSDGFNFAESELTRLAFGRYQNSARRAFASGVNPARPRRSVMFPNNHSYYYGTYNCGVSMRGDNLYPEKSRGCLRQTLVDGLANTIAPSLELTGRKTMKRAFGMMIVSVVVAIPIGGHSLKAAEDPELTSVVATFDTTTNDKDHDTYLDVHVYNNRGVLIAQKTGIGGHWNDHSTNEVGLDLVNRVKKSDVPAGRVRLTIHPNGNDKWEFNYHVTLTYGDDSATQKGWDGLVLTQDNSTTTNSWNGR